MNDAWKKIFETLLHQNVRILELKADVAALQSVLQQIPEYENVLKVHTSRERSKVAPLIAEERRLFSAMLESLAAASTEDPPKPN